MCASATDDSSSDRSAAAPAAGDAQLAEACRGRFIVFDGPDGSGKSTQLKRLAEVLVAAGLPLCEVREPGGTELGERVRRVLLDHTSEPVSARAEVLLYMASRAQLVERRIAPALAECHTVLADRFVSSTLAYQGTAGGVDRAEILDIARVACAQATPDLVVLFDVDTETAMARLSPLLRGGELDRMESKGTAFHRRVRQGYLDEARRDAERYLVVDASRGPGEVWAEVRRGLVARFGR